MIFRGKFALLIMAVQFHLPIFSAPQSTPEVPSDADSSPTIWMGPDGTALPFSSDEEVLEFLKTAQVLSKEKIPIGITAPRKVTLKKNGIRANGIFRTVDISQREWRGESGMVRKGFRDAFQYEGAAYELSRMLGLNWVPPAVLREVDGEEGSLQLWVEGAFTDQERIEENRIPPNLWRWNMQNQLMFVFDNLIFNDDRNQGNILYDENWQLWLVDHTRAFRVFRGLPYPEKIDYCERSLWDRLRSLDEEEVKSQLKPYLTTWEISTLLKRREALVKLIQGKIDQLGERKVLFNFY